MSSLDVLIYRENCTNYIIKIIVRPATKRCLAFMNYPVNIVKYYLLYCLRHEWEDVVI